MPVSGLRACPQQGAAAEADGGGCLLRCGHGRGRPRGGPPSGAAAPWNAVPYGYTSLPAQCMRACPALDAGMAPDRQQNTGGVGAAKFSLTAGAFAPIIERLTGCSAVGSALGSGPRGRGFKSPHSDQKAVSFCGDLPLFILFSCFLPQQLFEKTAGYYGNLSFLFPHEITPQWCKRPLWRRPPPAPCCSRKS